MEEGIFRSTATCKMQMNGNDTTSVICYRSVCNLLPCFVPYQAQRNVFFGRRRIGRISKELVDHSMSVDKARTHGMATLFGSAYPTGRWSKDDEWIWRRHLFQQVSRYYELITFIQTHLLKIRGREAWPYSIHRALRSYTHFHRSVVSFYRFKGR